MIRCLGLALLMAALGHMAGCTPDPLEPDPIGPSNGWRAFHPLPVGHNLADIWDSPDGSIWAVGKYGVIVHWDGEIVRRVDSPTRDHLVALDGRARDDIYAVGGDAVFRFDGRTWSLFKRFPGTPVDDVLCLDDGTLFTVSSQGVHVCCSGAWSKFDGPGFASSSVWLGDDGSVRVAEAGRIWRHNGISLVIEQALSGVSILEGDGRFVLGLRDDGQYEVYRRHPTGVWEVQLSGPSKIHCIADVGGLLVSDNGGISRVYISGQTTGIWANENGRWVYGLSESVDGGVLACGHSGTLLSGSMGSLEYTWQDASETIGFRAFNDLDGTGCDDIWAAEWWGRIMHYDGQQWFREDAPLDYFEPVLAIQALADGHVIAGGGQGGIAVRDPGGTWQRVMSPSGDIENFWGVTGDSVFAHTSDNQIRCWVDDEWRDAWPIDSPIVDITGTSDGGLYVLTFSEPATLHAWSGTGFDAVAEIPGVQGLRLHGSRTSGAVYLSGNTTGSPRRGVLYRYEAGILTHLTAGEHLPVSMQEVTEVRPGFLFASVSGEIWRLEGGLWSREEGLPSGEYYDDLWSHPDCGVFVHGYTTLFKPF